MIKVFDYLEELDAFVATQEFQDIARRLGLWEWSPVVWVGRFFTLDSDYGEHWFDNWEHRARIAPRAKLLGYNEDDLLIVAPERFQFPGWVDNYGDGPCHSEEHRKQFWTDVLKSLRLSLETICMEAREFAKDGLARPDCYESDELAAFREIEERIAEVRRRHGDSRRHRGHG